MLLSPFFYFFPVFLSNVNNPFTMSLKYTLNIPNIKRPNFFLHGKLTKFIVHKQKKIGLPAIVVSLVALLSSSDISDLLDSRIILVIFFS